MTRPPLEQHTRTEIDLRLSNLGWVLNERDPRCNVTQEHPKTEEQFKKLKGKPPDYLLYESGTDNPIGVIEAKRPGADLDKALNEAIEKYAKPLNVPLAFAFNDTFVTATHVSLSRPLKIDGEELQDFIDQLTALRFISEGPEIYSLPKGVTYTRDELLQKFKIIDNQLRNTGLRQGYERFSGLAEILFLKLVDESEYQKEKQGQKRNIELRYCWSDFVKKYNNKALVDFISDSVWPRLKQTYGDIFAGQFTIRSGSALDAIVELINPMNLTATGADVKGHAFEYFLKNVTNGVKDLGEYFTPRHIVRTMVHLVKPKFPESIYDPFCGTGGFLLEAFKYLQSRVEASNPDVLDTLQNRTLFGRELTSTARIAKMNMVLFGDGHTNIEQIDTLQNPVKEKYEVVLSNIPYSQKTDYGHLYPIPTDKGNSICVQHIWESLKPGGRAAVIVPETFLYEGNIYKKTRELICRSAKEISIISLPRGVFMPYTPQKTNILFFEKGKEFKHVFFFVVHNDGFELNTKRKPIAGDSDIRTLLTLYDDRRPISGKANIVSREDIVTSGNWNLRPFYYMEDIPLVKGDLVSLGKQKLIKEKKQETDPRHDPDKEWRVLEVSQHGVFLSDTLLGYDFKDKRKTINDKIILKVVNAGDIVYNPHRVNIGSIGVVPSHLDGSLVSSAYVVFRSVNSEYPPLYIMSVLKHPRYRKIIMNYSLGATRASLPFSELKRIMIPKPSEDIVKQLKSLDMEFDKHVSNSLKVREKVSNAVKRQMRNDDELDRNSHHLEDFNALLKKAATADSEDE